MTTNAPKHLADVAGFSMAGVCCGIKQEAGALDLGLLLCEKPAVCAAMFTTNKVFAAPIALSREHLKEGRARAVVVNSGNANACTGDGGFKDARTMTRLAAEGLGLCDDELLVCSTGVIGHRLPMEKIRSGIADAAANMKRTRPAATNFCKSIMTTDSFMKFASTSRRIGGKIVRFAGTAKGAGMIRPNMATMLAFVTSDVAVSRSLWRKALAAVVAESFNAITVDGHTSTNDTVVALASGRAGNVKITKAGPAYQQLLAALAEVCGTLSRMMVRDGEGATRVVTVTVTGAASKAEAERAARAIADSPLCKCAFFGGDPNWGRIVSAAGMCGVKMNPDRSVLQLGKCIAFRNGAPTRVAAKKLAAEVAGKDVAIRLDLAAGKADYTVTTCDLTYDYVKINAEYHT